MPADAPGTPRNAAEHRKPSKPGMEKRRRAPVSESLAQLSALILDAFRKGCRRSKLETADTLEMAVAHLQSLRRVQVTDPAVLGRYRAGLSECLAEVNRFLAGCEGVPADVRSRLLGHLAACPRQLGGPRAAPAARPLGGGPGVPGLPLPAARGVRRPFPAAAPRGSSRSGSRRA